MATPGASSLDQDQRLASGSTTSSDTILAVPQSARAMPRMNERKHFLDRRRADRLQCTSARAPRRLEQSTLTADPSHWAGRWHYSHEVPRDYLSLTPRLAVLLMNQRESVKLLFGPYRAPRLQRGNRPTCLVRDAYFAVTSWTDARMSWPRCRVVGSRGVRRRFTSSLSARRIQPCTGLAQSRSC
jgi:hypothetical protein